MTSLSSALKSCFWTCWLDCCLRLSCLSSQQNWSQWLRFFCLSQPHTPLACQLDSIFRNPMMYFYRAKLFVCCARMRKLFLCLPTEVYRKNSFLAVLGLVVEVFDSLFFPSLRFISVTFAWFMGSDIKRHNRKLPGYGLSEKNFFCFDL